MHFGSSIHELDLADGIKEMLIKHGYSLWSIRRARVSELASALGIDSYLAGLIQRAAKDFTDPMINGFNLNDGRIDKPHRHHHGRRRQYGSSNNNTNSTDSHHRHQTAIIRGSAGLLEEADDVATARVPV
jgi:hypothetical protein